MAKTIQEWQELIELEKATKPELDALNSPSATSVWKAIRNTFAFCAWVLENILETFKTEVESIIEQRASVNDLWLAQAVTKFQLGDPLLVNSQTLQYYYETVDPEKQIVAKRAVQSSGGVALLKVAKADGPLTPEELTALGAYVDRIQIPGSNIKLLSKAADRLKLPLTIYYDPLYELSELIIAIEAAIQGYITALPFNGAFYVSKLLDAVKAIPGVVDVTQEGIEAKSEENEIVQVDRLIFPVSGQLVIDPAYPLADVLTYIPEL